MPDYSEYRLAEKLKAEQARATDSARHATLERALRTLGTQMEDLVGADAWATVQKALNAALAGERTALASLRDQILAPDCVGDALLRLKLEAQRIAGRIEGLETALRVPATYQSMAAMATEAG